MKRCLCLDLDLWVSDGCAGHQATDAVEAMIPYWSEVREGIAHCLDLDVHGCTADDHRALRPSKGFELLLHVGVRETHRWSWSRHQHRRCRRSDHHGGAPDVCEPMREPVLQYRWRRGGHDEHDELGAVHEQLVDTFTVRSAQPTVRSFWKMRQPYSAWPAGSSLQPRR